MQCACTCKGYPPGPLTGTFTPATQQAVTTPMADAGRQTTLANTVPPKITKALLAIDSYLLASGDSAPARGVQQWLNNRYLPRTNWFLLPYDGVLTRDLETVLRVAMQYETGLTDAQADGSFGTQSKYANGSGRYTGENPTVSP